MSKYTIPIIWQSIKNYEVEAESLQEAVAIATKEFLAEPDDNYLCDSFEIDSILEENYPNEKYNLND
jgi:hypothetical protein